MNSLQRVGKAIAITLAVILVATTIAPLFHILAVIVGTTLSGFIAGNIVGVDGDEALMVGVSVALLLGCGLIALHFGAGMLPHLSPLAVFFFAGVGMVYSAAIITIGAWIGGAKGS